MPTNEHHRTSTPISGLRRSYEVDDIRIMMSHSQSPAPDTDGTVRYGMLACSSRLVAISTNVCSGTRETRAFIVGGPETTFYDWLQESRAVIRHAAPRGW
jgi:hypothetical protein